ncbi:hypothetical protein [Lacihabitans soyangensis]|uniref:Uncharacterized protein n=1 Tax=Lacihabitans soyangensis TaxID=869394 RepID=A0AAE3H2A0_9BACT|nr:hypothetical protein [Lacihabitans soyangensis]MCP9762659.1 hypothetical protein [Lacihabitans soyangensis]
MQTLSNTHPAPIAELKAALIADIKKIWPLRVLLDTTTGYLKSGDNANGIYQFWNIKKPGSSFVYQIDYMKDDLFIRFKLSSKEFFNAKD